MPRPRPRYKRSQTLLTKPDHPKNCSPNNHETTYFINICTGIQSMLVIIREKFWVKKGRKTIKCVFSQCVICQIFRSKAVEAPFVPLPLLRIADCNAHQSTGIDLAGSQKHLRSGNKTWVVLFSCAVYRAMELVLSYPRNLLWLLYKGLFLGEEDVHLCKRTMEPTLLAQLHYEKFGLEIYHRKV